MSDTPTPFKRLPNGLFEGKTYHYRPDGRIDWKRHIPSEHIVFNATSPQLAEVIKEAYGAPAKELVYADVIASGKEVDDKHILVLLAGYVEVAELRGYTSSIPVSISNGHSWRRRDPYDKKSARDVNDCVVSIGWKIDWIANDEEPQGKTSGGAADATFENTGDWGYLTAMAENRSFVRAVKRGLGIRILGFDEVAKVDQKDVLPESGPSPSTFSLPNPNTLLDKAAAEGKFTFDQVKAAALKRWEKPAEFKEKIETDPGAWTSFATVPPRDCLTLIKLIKGTKKKT